MTAMSTRGHSGAHSGHAKWLIVMLLGVVAACLLAELGLGASPAGADVSRGQADHIVCVAGKVTDETYGLYLVDLKNGTISVYQYLSSKRKLRLMAARNYTFDVQLDEYNTEPAPREIKQLVQQQKRLTETK